VVGDFPYFKQNTTLWNAADFIAALTQFVPPWGVRYVRPRCGSQMKLIAVITDPAEVGKILRHLVKTGRAPPGLDPSLLL